MDGWMGECCLSPYLCNTAIRESHTLPGQNVRTFNRSTIRISDTYAENDENTIYVTWMVHEWIQTNACRCRARCRCNFFLLVGVVGRVGKWLWKVIGRYVLRRWTCGYEVKIERECEWECLLECWQHTMSDSQCWVLVNSKAQSILWLHNYSFCSIVEWLSLSLSLFLFATINPIIVLF